MASIDSVSYIVNAIRKCDTTEKPFDKLILQTVSEKIKKVSEEEWQKGQRL